MEWWNSFLDWLTAASTRPVLFVIVVIVLAIVVSSVLAAWVSRGAIHQVLTQRNHEIKVAAIGALVDAATEASVWNSLTPQEQVMSDRLVGQADIQVRLLPIRGSGIAASWAAHQLQDLKRTSATFGYQLEPALIEFRDRLIDWQNRPSRARRIFQGDLERWALQNSTSEKSLLAEQDAWVAQQHHDDFSRLESGAPVPANTGGITPVRASTAPTSPSPGNRVPAHTAPTDVAQAEPAPLKRLSDIGNPARPETSRPEPQRPLGSPVATIASTTAEGAEPTPKPAVARATSTASFGSNSSASPSAETQRLLDDVQALEVRPSSDQPSN
jgi:hypothetical protein